MKILLTGAGGYIGSHVLKKLVAKNVEIIANDLNFRERIDRIIYNTDSLFSMTDPYLELGCPDICIHLAWRNGFIHNAETHIQDLSNHFNFINKMLASGLKHIAIMGSMHEVGYHEGMISENTECSPLSLYGIAKNALRQSSSIIANKYGAIWQWLRAYYIYGDDINGSSIFSKIAQAVARGDKSFPLNSGKNQYDFIHIDKLAEIIIDVVQNNNIRGIVECCSGIPVPLSEQIEKYIQDNKFDIKLEYGKFPDRPYDSPIIYGDTSKIKHMNK